MTLPFVSLPPPGANVNRATANNDHTVVSLSCAGGHLAVVELLLAHGADPTHRLKVSSPVPSSWAERSQERNLMLRMLHCKHYNGLL